MNYSRVLLLTLCFTSFAGVTAYPPEAMALPTPEATAYEEVAKLVEDCVQKKITEKQMMDGIKKLVERFGGQTVKEAITRFLNVTQGRLQNYIEWSMRHLPQGADKVIQSIKNYNLRMALSSEILMSLRLGAGFGFTIIPENWQLLTPTLGGYPGDIMYDDPQAMLDLQMEEEYVVADAGDSEDLEEPEDEDESSSGGGGGGEGSNSSEMCCGRELELVPPLSQCFPWPHGPRRFPVAEEFLELAESMTYVDDGTWEIRGLYVWNAYSPSYNTQSVSYGVLVTDAYGGEDIVRFTSSLDGYEYCYSVSHW